MMQYRAAWVRCAAVCFAAALAACAGSRQDGGVLAPLASSHSRPAVAKLVGYWDGWQRNNLKQTPAGVTSIPVAFGYLHGHTITLGGINNGYVTAADIAALHARGITVTLSLGGWSPYNSFVFDGDTAGFEKNLQALLAKLPFDGVDFDEEHGATSKRVRDLSTLIPATRAFFNSIGMTGAIVTYPAWNKPSDYGDDQILRNSKVAAALSWVNVMSYEHNDVGRTETDVAAYGAIFDRTRLMLGVDIDDKPTPTNASLQALHSWVVSNGYGGMMAWTVNGITPEQLAAMTGS